MQNNYVFRLSIVHPKELNLLKTRTTDGGLLGMQDTSESKRFELDYVHRPQHAAIVSG